MSRTIVTDEETLAAIIKSAIESSHTIATPAQEVETEPLISQRQAALILGLDLKGTGWIKTMQRYSNPKRYDHPLPVYRGLESPKYLASDCVLFREHKCCNADTREKMREEKQRLTHS